MKYQEVQQVAKAQSAYLMFEEAPGSSNRRRHHYCVPWFLDGHAICGFSPSEWNAFILMELLDPLEAHWA